MTQEDLQDVFLSSLVGLPAWGARQGYGSFLTIEFGNPCFEHPMQLRDGSKPRSDLTSYGEWHVWIYCCHWRILSDDQELADSEANFLKIEQALDVISGQTLLGIHVDQLNGRSEFEFANDRILQTWPYGDDLQEKQWHIYGSEGVLTYLANGTLLVEPSVVQ